MMQWRSPQLFRVNSVVSGYVNIHLRSISDFTVKVKRLIRFDNFTGVEASVPAAWGAGRTQHLQAS
jgi:hypothetical protein